MSKKFLIINADDFGMSMPVSKGILKAAGSDVVRSTSVMTNCESFSASIDELASSGINLDVGFHATLTWGRPISDPHKVPSLVNKEGKFHSKASFLTRSFLGMISKKEVYEELRVQCKRLKERVPTISHIDGHHHVHTYPLVRSAVERIAREFKIPFVRAPREGMWSPLSWSGAKRLAIAMLPSSSPLYWRMRGFRTADHFGGFGLGESEKFKDRWMKVFERIPEGVSEIMVHPGYSSSENDSYKGREKEIEWLVDEKLVNAARKSGISFTSFDVLSEIRGS
ncbi:MAG: ChbG/HpnK family deacetylase [Pseudomonadota bacterium]